MNVEENDKVSIEYVGRLDDGQIFDSTVEAGQPLTFQVGSGTVLPDFEKALLGLGEGQEKKIKLSADQAYGQIQEHLIQKVPRKGLPENVKEGMMLIAQTDQEKQIPVNVVKVGDDSVTVDLNHPLSGKDLNFEVKVLKIEKNQSPSE